MTTPQIVLHEWCISPFCTKVRKILDFKGPPYRLEEYGGMRALKVKSLSSVGKLPVLDYDGERVQDSSAIARFLEARHPTPSLFPASVDPFLIHMLEDWADESLYWYEVWLRLYDDQACELAARAACAGRPDYERFLFQTGFKRHRTNANAQGIGRMSREAVLANFREHLAMINGRLHSQPWLAGDAVSLADIAVSAQLDEVVRTSPLATEIDALPALRQWRARCNFPSAAALNSGNEATRAGGSTREIAR